MARIPTDFDTDNTSAPEISPLEALKKRRQELIDQGNQVAADAINRRIMELEGTSEPAVAEPVVAEPMTPKQESQFDGVEIEDEIPEAVAQPTAALQTPTPVPQKPATPSVEPGKTAAVDAAMNEPKQPESKPQEDEYETLFKNYEQARKQYDVDMADYEEKMSETERRNQMTTGIVGALSAFGEGLAAITGGSAKPLQAGVAALKDIGSQQVAAQERKVKTIKERLQMARDPLETKAGDIKFRELFEKKQREKRMLDPNSEESNQAREVANQTLNALVASFRSAGNPQAADELLNTKPFIDKASGKQINDLFEQIKDLSIKPTISAAQKQAYAMQLVEKKGEIQQTLAKQKQQFQSKLTNLRTDAARVNLATKEYQEIVPKINADVKDVKALGNQVDKFIGLLDQASDPKLMSNEAKRQQINEAIAAQKEILNYMNARKYESKGVFTDQDLLALSQLKTYGTWADQFTNWLKKGVYNEETAKQIRVMRDIMRERKRDFKNPGYAVARGYSQIFRDTAELYSSMENNVDAARTLIRYSDLLEKRFSPDVVGQYNSPADLQDKVDRGEIKLEDGDIVEIQGVRYEKIGKTLEPLK